MTASPLLLALAIVEGHHLLGLVDEFIALLDGPRDAGDAALNRLAPDPYPDDAEAARDYRRATRDDLFDQRLADALEVRTTLEIFEHDTIEHDAESVDAESGDAESSEADPLATRPISIDPAHLDAWLRTLAAIRLVLASRLGIGVHDTHAADDPRFSTYDWLGYRLDHLIGLADRNTG
ncbi:DUF2017 family protein [Microbacterium sp. YJN-G]|uniref:DUF2017 family protein n=1 Tax=Microbacterium sp. YJN-G TaxID=2763257 RepID=UPI001877BD05|nr:DUF2017 family protein [Microbacterium sp. YJN-G]